MMRWYELRESRTNLILRIHMCDKYEGVYILTVFTHTWNLNMFVTAARTCVCIYICICVSHMYDMQQYTNMTDISNLRVFVCVCVHVCLCVCACACAAERERERSFSARGAMLLCRCICGYGPLITLVRFDSVHFL